MAPSWTRTRSPFGETWISAIALAVSPSVRGGAVPVSAATVFGLVTTTWWDQSSDAITVRSDDFAPRYVGSPPASGQTVTSPSAPPVITSAPSRVSWRTSGAEGAMPRMRTWPVRRS